MSATDSPTRRHVINGLHLGCLANGMERPRAESVHISCPHNPRNTTKHPNSPLRNVLKTNENKIVLAFSQNAPEMPPSVRRRLPRRPGQERCFRKKLPHAPATPPLQPTDRTGGRSTAPKRPQARCPQATETTY